MEFARGKAKSLKTEDKTEALRLYKRIEKAYTDRKLVWLESNARILLSQFAEEYTDKRTGLKADNTVRLDRESFEKLISFAGDIPISYLSEKKCDDFVVHLQRSGLKATTVNIAIRQLKAAFNKAVKNGALKRSGGCTQLLVELRNRITVCNLTVNASIFGDFERFSQMDEN